MTSEESVTSTETQSLDQVVNRMASMLPPSIDCDDECGEEPSELYGKYTWKIHKFSNLEKRELRSNTFEVGDCKWYILIYPQGCFVDDHISLFLCIANHEELLPGWSHFAQFTISVVNQDQKKSKYSDTLHRFWKKEHDWGWKKYMETSKTLDGFLEDDTFTIKTQIQVIRERADRPFRCLDFQYKRELLRVYLSNVKQICRLFIEDNRRGFQKLIGDNGRWSSFCSFWSGVVETSQHRLSSERSDLILKEVVKHFFIEKEVTSTLMMECLYSGLQALESRSKRGRANGKLLDREEPPILIVQMDQGMFVLVEDVPTLLERLALEPSSPKEENDYVNRTTDGDSGEDSFNMDCIHRDERRLVELGHQTIEVFVVAHIFSKIEAAYEEAVPYALKSQEETTDQ